jgi:hypothetical protein
MGWKFKFIQMPKISVREPRLIKDVWHGNWLMGIGGPPEGPRDRAFVRWCRKKSNLCIRTVNLFWYLDYHPRSFPTFSKRALRQMWQYEVKRFRALLTSSFRIAEGNRWRRMTAKEVREYVRTWYPHPGRWDFYYRNRKHYYMENLSRYESVRNFWKRCPASARRRISRCRRYSNRVPEAHPDYYVVFRGSGGRPLHGFVEVKGFRESIRPSQKRFFPELVKKNSQQIWIVRIEPHGRKLRWYRVGASGPNRMLESPVG